MLTPGDVIFGSLVLLGFLAISALLFTAWVIDTFNTLRRKVKSKWKAIRDQSTTKPPGNT